MALKAGFETRQGGRRKGLLLRPRFALHAGLVLTLGIYFSAKRFQDVLKVEDMNVPEDASVVQKH